VLPGCCGCSVMGSAAASGCEASARSVDAMFLVIYGLVPLCQAGGIESFLTGPSGDAGLVSEQVAVLDASVLKLSTKDPRTG